MGSSPLPVRLAEYVARYVWLSALLATAAACGNDFDALFVGRAADAGSSDAPASTTSRTDASSQDARDVTVGACQNRTSSDGRCEIACVERAACNVTCIDPKGCNLTCSGPECRGELWCGEASVPCSATCRDGAKCALACRDGQPCSLACESGASCLLHCEGAGCDLQCQTGSTRRCDDNVVVCNRECP